MSWYTVRCSPVQLDSYEMETSVLCRPAGFSHGSCRNRRLVSVQKAKEEPLYSKSLPQFVTSRKLLWLTRGSARCMLPHYHLKLSFILYFFPDGYCFFCFSLWMLGNRLFTYKTNYFCFGEWVFLKHQSIWWFVHISYLELVCLFNKGFSPRLWELDVFILFHCLRRNIPFIWAL